MHCGRRFERLARYVLRPPLAMDRLEALSDGRLAYRLKTPWRDGTTHILMERHELLERLAPLIPPPRAHQVRYYGILAPCASGRDSVVPGAREAAAAASAAKRGNREAACALDPTRTCRPPDAETGPAAKITAPEGAPSAASECGSGASQAAQADQAPGSTQQPVTPRPVSSVRPRRLPWADLLQRIFGVEALRCECGHPMRVMAATATVRIAAASSPPPSPSRLWRNAFSSAWASRPGHPLSRRRAHPAPLRTPGSKNTLRPTSTRRPQMTIGVQAREQSPLLPEGASSAIQGPLRSSASPRAGPPASAICPASARGARRAPTCSAGP